MGDQRVWHNPKGDPCQACGKAAHVHRVEHQPCGDPCDKCGKPAAAHLRKNPRKNEDRGYYVGIDGEGQGRDDHRYVMLAWSNHDKTRKGVLEAQPGGRLTTKQCLDFILTIPNRAKVFAFAFQYDLAMMLRDMDDPQLYLLMHPECRRWPAGLKRFGKPPVNWQGYKLNFLAGKFSVRKGKAQTVIWDIFKFFQSKFTTAIEEWFKPDPDAKPPTVGDKRWPEMAEVVERMLRMKNQRADFDKLGRAEILDYCYDECAYMARLAERLTDAHEEAGLRLKNYHGAGSTASALLDKFGIADQEREGPAEASQAFASAFFGGRFENSIVGRIPGPVWSYDISSAYPYQLTFLPCLGCGKWEHSTKRKDIDAPNVRAACVRYRLGKPPPGLTWGPFPFRIGQGHEKGSIVFPSTSGGGWVWQDEFKQGERWFPHVRFMEAWIYKTECTCQPFARLPQYYLDRLRLGKEGRGIVIKLGMNSVYGKLAQSVGGDEKKPKYQSWVWAGMITSGTRAQILEMLGLHRDRSNMLMVATDGIYSLEKIEPPKPRETGTMTETHKKPLGGWERNIAEGGMFAARPGIYFPQEPTEADMKKIRARGVGRMAVLKNWQELIATYERGEPKNAQGDTYFKLPDIPRFHGIRSSIYRVYKQGEGFRYIRKPEFAQWRTWPVEMTFNPMPKRQGINPDSTLQIRAFSQDSVSAPYDRADALANSEAQSLRFFAAMLLEQPESADFSEYEESPVD